ncbi:MAG: hypothetical protein NZ772_09795 [Cyanobacteria bacterium]|nr:hypothetical protein [Cyanobacteriota bacterium]MDW8200946.1 hypothetical protein [Cyanobacteriota bacterium SKYGB_h_bin112]
MVREQSQDGSSPSPVPVMLVSSGCGRYGGGNRSSQRPARSSAMLCLSVSLLAGVPSLFFGIG